MRPHLEEAWRALRLADRDIYAFTILKNDEKAHLSVVYFHAQQAVEKLLKAVLFSAQIEFRCTHDLIEPASLLQKNEIKKPIAVTQLARLDPYAVTYRYDGMEFDAYQLTHKEAVQWVNSLRTWAEDMLNTALKTSESPLTIHP